MKIKKYLSSIFILTALGGIFTVSPKVTFAGYCEGANAATRAQCEDNDGVWYEGAAPVQTCTTVNGIEKIICEIGKIINLIIPMLMALGLIYFIWGVVEYMIGGDVESKKKGRDHIIYGLIGLAVIVGVWGIVNIVINTFGLKGAADIEIPAVATANSCSQTSDIPPNPTFKDLVCYAVTTINDAIIPLIFALAILTFLWGVVQFVINSDDEVKKTKGKNFMLWGIIALTVMVSIWGLVNILSSTFNVNGSVIPQVKP